MENSKMMDKEIIINGIKYRQIEEEINLPKTYKEAAEQYPSEQLFKTYKDNCKKLIQFEKLIFLRDIYRQGWVPDLEEPDIKYVLLCIYNNVRKSTEMGMGYSKVLSFQSEEIRDEFYNNFKDLIEECKEFI